MTSYLRVYPVDPCDILEVDNIDKLRLTRHRMECCYFLGEYAFVTLLRIVTSYRDSVDGTRNHVTYQTLVTR
jgi:hypothetical protein